MRLFLVVAFIFASMSVSACGKRPVNLEVPVNNTDTAKGYPAVEPVPDMPEEYPKKN